MKVSRIPGHAFSVYRNLQRVHCHSRFHAADGLTANYDSPCAVRVHCGTALRHPEIYCRLSQDLHQADRDHVAVQYHH